MPATVNSISHFVHRTRQVYSLPAVALEVLELTANPRVDCRKLRSCIEYDPALVGKILRVVNSSLFGLNRKVTDLNQALALLGIKPLKLLVLGFNLSEVMFKGRTGEAMQHAWRHTITRAVAAHEICEAVWRVPGDEAFTAGLLAGLGKFILLDELGEPYADLLVEAANERDNLSRLEQSSLGFDHYQLSVELLRHWNLPATLVNAVRLSARPGQYDMLDPQDKQLPAAVRMGGLVADLIVDGRHDCLRELVSDPFEQLLLGQPCSEHYKVRLTESGLEQLIDRVNERMDTLADKLQFDLPPDRDYRDLLAAAHEQLSIVATEASCAVARQWPLVEDQGADVYELSAALACSADQFADFNGSYELPPLLEAENKRVSSSKEHVPSFLSKQLNSFGKETAQNYAEGHGNAATALMDDEAAPRAKLLERLTMMVDHCRQSRCPLSLVLLEIDHFNDLAQVNGAEVAQQTAHRLHAAAGSIEREGSVCVRLGDAEFGLLFPNCDRLAAVSKGQQLLRGMCPIHGATLVDPSAPTLSVGVATVTVVSKNFPPPDLLKAATRCLNAAQLLGGNMLKSIDV